MGFMNPLFSGMSSSLGPSLGGSLQGLLGGSTMPAMNGWSAQLPFGMLGPSQGNITTNMGMPPMLQAPQSGPGNGNAISGLASLGYPNTISPIMSALLPILQGLSGNSQFYMPQQGIPQSPSGPVTSPLNQTPNPFQIIGSLLKPITTQPVAQRPETPTQPQRNPRLPIDGSGDGGGGLGGRGGDVGFLFGRRRVPFVPLGLD